MLKWLLGAVIAAIPIAAQAQSVTIARGEAVTLALDEADGKTTPHEIDRKPAPDASVFETAAAAKFASGAFDKAVGANGQPMSDAEIGAASPKAAPNTLQLHFFRTPLKDQSLLIIVNGFDRGMVYRATMRVKGQSQATDVCLVMPGKVGMEDWPFAIDSLDVSDFKLVPWKPEDGIVCA
ncbi:hypothetical protein [Sphingomonas sp.]|jgi:hypothetical protein|uniref:hypothetical protein n=1 Tax=Sphingomonas sp. TaxID=28214 RepID=UPI002E379A3F|nr:hypothetical protein [Sphingomonas sp.]HEX4695118.1 hypothetical protein [Sphingomonas sp.]